MRLDAFVSMVTRQIRKITKFNFDEVKKITMSKNVRSVRAAFAIKKDADPNEINENTVKGVNLAIYCT